MFDKARQQAEKVRMVLDKITTDCLSPTTEVVCNKIEQPLPLGHPKAGVMSGIAPGFEGFKVEDRVMSNGKHAQMVAVSKNLCVRIHNCVSDEAATVTVSLASALVDPINEHVKRWEQSF